jgi:hypothetical protein
MWCGLAVVYADYGELASYIREYDAGWTVPPDDPEAIRQTLRQILSDPQEARRRGRNAQRLVARRLTWDHTIAPLDTFCHNPRRRTGAPAVASPVLPSQSYPDELRLRHRFLRGVLEMAGLPGCTAKTPESFRRRMRDVFGIDRTAV